MRNAFVRLRERIQFQLIGYKLLYENLSPMSLGLSMNQCLECI